MAAALLCCLMAGPGLAFGMGDASMAIGSGSRRLLGGASATKRALQRSDGQPGELTDWLLACQDGRQRCPSTFLASWGFQCANQEGDSCCLQPNGKDCTRLDEWADQPAPDTWQGRDLTAAQAPAPATAAVSTDSSSDSDKQGKKHGSAGSSDSEGEWKTASCTTYWSYPDCCHDPSADQTECDDYSGCQWEGQFAALDGKQSKSWVMENNIASFFESPNSQNRKEWDRKWKNKTLRIRNPDTGKTLDVKVLDTCDDADCDGCCTQNANKNGGHLVDLEYYTAQRFWGEGHAVDNSSVIEWQLLD
ncbi:hypothetical protein ABPG75_010397 [Micractinium tetrahymenae]